MAGHIKQDMVAARRAALVDIGSMIRIQGKKLDAAAIDAIAARLGVLGAWRALWERNHPEST